jgi:hypothetical protein
MTVGKSKTLPINSAARNAVWVFDAVTEPRFIGAPDIVEKRRSHEMPDVVSLPAGADLAVELYGGAVTLRLDGGRRRVCVRRFEFVPFASDEEARHGFLTLWREVEALESASEVERAAEDWLGRRRAG